MAHSNRFELLKVIELTEINAGNIGNSESSDSSHFNQVDEATLPSSPSFFDLPRELRDLTYSFALAPQTPIELAPLQCADDFVPQLQNSFRVYEVQPGNGPPYIPEAEYEKHPWGGYSGEEWHKERYLTQIQPSLKLLRVSKQVRAEASPIFYG